MGKKLTPDKYDLIARIYPATIVLIPFLLFTMNCNSLNLLLHTLLKVKIVGNITIALILLYLLAQISRFLSKFIFESSYFKNDLDFPTTRFMLFVDPQFSRDYKMQIRAKVKSDFKIDLPNELEEREDLLESKKRIVETVGLIREKVKGGRLLLQHNIEYGFARNLIGGAVIGLVMSIVDIVYFYLMNNSLIFFVSIFTAFLFLIILLSSKLIMNRLGDQYAKRLFVEYLNSQK